MKVEDKVRVNYDYPLPEFRGAIGLVIKEYIRVDRYDVVFEEWKGYFKFKSNDLELLQSGHPAWTAKKEG